MDAEADRLEVLSVRMPSRELAILRQLAEADERSLSQVARRILRSAVKSEATRDQDAAQHQPNASASR